MLTVEIDPCDDDDASIVFEDHVRATTQIEGVLMTITIQVEGTALDRLQELIDRMEDPTSRMEQIAEAPRDHTEHAFETEGPGWYPLAAATVHQRGSDHPILQRSGQLASSLAIAYGRSYAAVGSNKVYAAIQQLGGQAGWGHRTRIPARPYLPASAGGELTPAVEHDVLDIIGRYLSVQP